MKTASQTLRFTAALAVVTLVAFLVADLCNLWVEGRLMTPPRLQIGPLRVPASSSPRPLEEYVKRTQALFGTPRVVPASPGKTSASTPAPLPWDDILKDNPPTGIRLMATVVGSGASLALFQVGEREAALGPGDRAGSYTLETVGAQQVTFRGPGGTRILKMAGPDAPASGESSPGGAPAGAAAPPLPPRSPSSSVTVFPQKKVLERREVLAMLEDPAQLGKEVKLTPVDREGRPYGIQVTFLSGQGLFTQLGLALGDVITSINNKKVFTPEEAFDAYQALRNEDHLVLQVERGGNIVTIQVELR